MFMFTLVQSRTYVHSVPAVLHGLHSSGCIFWSHMVKALGSRVTFVGRNLPANVVLNSICFVTMT